MNPERMAALLGRPLTSIETANYILYFDIAEENLEELICTPVHDVLETRTFDTRYGYKTAFVDIFWGIDEVKLDGETIDADDYSLRQWDKRNASWYNSIVFEDYLDGKELEVTASWGFEAGSGDDSNLPADLQSVLAGLFGLISKKNNFDGTIQSKQVEDFRITFRADTDLDDEFYKNYERTIAKYSLCNVGNIRQGKVCNRCTLRSCTC